MQLFQFYRPQLKWLVLTFVSFSFLTACNGGTSSPDMADRNASVNNPTPPPSAATNNSPTATADSATVISGSSNNAIDVLANDSDIDGDTISLASFTQPATGSGTVSRDDNGTPNDLTDDQLLYNPGNSSNDATFTYTITDGQDAQASATVTVSITPNTAPSATDDTADHQRGQNNDPIDVLVNDSDANNDAIQLTTFDVMTTNGGQIGRDNNNTPDDLTDDKLVYTPPNGFNGDDTFTYNISDGNGGTDTATVTVTVIAEPAAAQGCTDKAARLANNMGYCFNAFFNTAHDRTPDNLQGTKIDMTVYIPHPDTLPNSANPGDGYAPFLLHGHGFGGAKNGDFGVNTRHFVDNQAALAAWMEKGWFVISFSERGFGQSGGQIGFMTPELEGRDINEILDWAIKHIRGESTAGAGDDIYAFTFDETNTDHTSSVSTADTRPSLLMNDIQTRLDPSTTGAVANPAAGTLGYSYGGGFQYTASHADNAASNITASTIKDRWNAHVPEGTWHDLRYALHANDVPKTYWATLLFSFAAQGGTGSNGEPLPPFLVNVYSEAVTTQRVSADNQNLLAENGTSFYCDFITPLESQADVFHIQGVRDTLFNFNEGYDNVRCFDDAGLDARFLAVSGGHPYTAYQTVNTSRVPYTNQTTSMDIDEIVHCGVDANGDPIRLSVTEMILAWYDEKLAGVIGAADIVPKVCIAQHNTDPTDSLDDPRFSQQQDSQFYYLKEGVVYDAIDDILVGAGDAPNYTCDADVAGATPGRCEIDVDVQIGGAAQTAPFVDIPLVTIDANTTQVMAGIPTVKLDIANVMPSNPLIMLPTEDYKIFLSITLTRGDEFRILHDQVTPIRGTSQYPYVAFAHATDMDLDATDDDVVVTENDNPIVYGCGMDAESLADCPEGDRGRLIGVTTRLLPGDIIGLRISAGDFQYAGITNTPSQLSIEGDIELPILAPTPLPTSVNP